jgi:CMP/dCMP kinase
LPISRSSEVVLTAAAEERARRRQHELAARGVHLALNEILDQQDERDRRDESRECSPLAPATDAILVDTTGLTVEEVVDLLFGRIGFVPVVDR